MWNITRTHRVPSPGFFRMYDRVHVDSIGLVGKTDDYMFNTEWSAGKFSQGVKQIVDYDDGWLVLKDGTRFKNVCPSLVRRHVVEKTCNNAAALSIVNNFEKTGRLDTKHRRIVGYHEAMHVLTHGTTLVKSGDWRGHVTSFNDKGGGRVFMTHAKRQVTKEEEWTARMIHKNSYVHMPSGEIM